MRELLLLFCLFLVCLESRVKTNPVLKSKHSTTCGYESCPATKKNMLNVHLIPHTHDDVGWLKTVDQYYYGLKTDVQKAGVQYILDSVIDELLKDKSRRFIYVEIAFFWKWWAEQTDSRRHQVKKLVQNGQLEFIGGGWSMNDEATVNYQSTIDQFTWGFRKLNDTFGYCARPRVGWQIDPFGHSRETASIMARLGFDGLFFGRLDYQDKDARLEQKRAEMIWQASPKNLGKSANLFTGVLFNTYSPPPTFCFDILCSDEPIVDNKKSPDYNADRRVRQFLSYVVGESKYYETNHVTVTMGGDFTYQSAQLWFINMDKLIRVANAMQVNGSDINLLYSTPSCYLKAVNDENLSYTTKDDDFFPYASDPHTYWTGYFSSRPTLKYLERKGNNFLQICKQLYALTDLGPEDKVELNSLRNAMGVMQHHDAITGTEKQLVAFDYARLLYDGITKCEDVAEVALRKLTEKQPQVGPPNPNQHFPFITCPLLNVTQCEITENFDSFVITLYNPLSYPVTKNVRLPIKDDKRGYVILCPMGKEQVSQIVPIPESVQNIPGRFSQASYELVFRAYNLPALGFRSYYISRSVKRLPNGGPLMSVPSQRFQTQYTTIGNQACFNVRKTFTGPLNSGFSFNGRTYENFNSTSTTNSNCLKFSAGEEGSFVKRGSGAAAPFTQGFYFYRGAVGDNRSFQNRSSGAYIFRPNGSDPYIIGDGVKRETFKGPVVEEIHETYSDWVSQVIRVYKGDSHAEFEWLVGPIPVEDGIGKEVIHRFDSAIQSRGVFYTDSNGREMLERVRNHRPTWNVSISEPISANYYPITSKITVKDDKLQMSILTDRAQGGSSINDGEVELMVHRRCLRDDAFGVGEALNEMAFGKGLVARGTHYLTFGSPQSQNSIERTLALEKLLDVWTFLTPTPITSFDQWRQNFKMEYSGLSEALPKNIHILTLEPWKGRSMLLRLEHTFEVGEDPVFSAPVTVDIKKLFYPFTITSFEETTLGGNLFVKDMKRMQWKTETNSVNDQFNSEDFINYKQFETSDITLKPMEIRTFIIEVQFNKFSL